MNLFDIHFFDCDCYIRGSYIRRAAGNIQSWRGYGVIISRPLVIILSGEMLGTCILLSDLKKYYIDLADFYIKKAL